jgi:zinc/manganese transport system substrate-binding protein
VSQWSDIVQRLAGPCSEVTTILSSSSIDPHDYEPTPADLARFEDAQLVVENGLDYDAWAAKAVAAMSRKPVVVNGGDVVGLADGDNPHIWYGPAYVTKVADAVSAVLERLRPAAAPELKARRAAFTTELEPYVEAIAAIRASAGGKRYAATEGVFDDMAAALGLVDVTPKGYRKAAANESEPAPGDIDAFHKELAGKRVDVLIDNTQTEGAIPAQIRRAAESAGVAVVDVTESPPPGATSFVDWQVEQLRQLSAAMGAA